MSDHFASELDAALRRYLERYGFNLEPGQFPPPLAGIMPTIQIGSLLAETGRPWEEVAVAQHFSCSVSVTGVAAKYGSAQILNPAGSGVTIYVTEFSQYRSAGIFSLAGHNTALSTAITTTGSQKIDSTASKGTPFSEAVAALQTDELWSNVNGLDSQQRFSFLKNPWQLDPGKGILIQHSVVNQLERFGIQWVEVPT